MEYRIRVIEDLFGSKSVRVSVTNDFDFIVVFRMTCFGRPQDPHSVWVPLYCFVQHQIVLIIFTLD